MVIYPTLLIPIPAQLKTILSPSRGYPSFRYVLCSLEQLKPNSPVVRRTRPAWSFRQTPGREGALSVLVVQPPERLDKWPSAGDPSPPPRRRFHITN
ncbi:hypothetical protein AMEX_G20984 [Astyanax mexicanus]|uniref:Uncharacterized protein n=1 Tax=Astyanax mexicanus TaxID=7994 RepID=A0A8T2L3S1_ASTMX|nr:hypothetical protein AMEX_G20984 [Astyanax mexicanus]